MTPILLLGDSLIANFNWQKALPNYTVHNHGVPGIMTSDLLEVLPEVKAEVAYAEIIMVMIGTNDLLTGNFDTLQILKKILVQLTNDYPAAEILVCSILPMDLPYLPDNAISSLNCHIEALTMRTGCCFLNIYDRFKAAHNSLFAEDGVHLTVEAYEIWRRTLLEHIAFLLEDD